MADTLGPEKCIALHTFSECDMVSSFAGRGKTTVREIWRVFDEDTPALCTLASTPELNQLQLLERFVVLLYVRTNSVMDVNEAWKRLFSQKGR